MPVFRNVIRRKAESLRTNSGSTRAQAGALLLILVGAIGLIGSFFIDAFVSRSPFEGVLGVVGLLLAAIGGVIYRVIHSRAGSERESLWGEGIAVVAAAGAIQEGIRQWLYYGPKIRINTATTTIFVGVWAAVGVAWYLARWRKADGR